MVFLCTSYVSNSALSSTPHFSRVFHHLPLFPSTEEDFLHQPAGPVPPPQPVPPTTISPILPSQVATVSKSSRNLLRSVVDRVRQRALEKPPVWNLPKSRHVFLHHFRFRYEDRRHPSGSLPSLKKREERAKFLWIKKNWGKTCSGVYFFCCCRKIPNPGSYRRVWNFSKISSDSRVIKSILVYAIFPGSSLFFNNSRAISEKL